MMEIKTISEINEYVGTSVNPLDTPYELFELYSVPSYDNQYPEIIKGSAIGSTKITVQENDVLICKINPRINRVWLVKHHTPYRLLASSEWIVVRNKHINPQYLQWYFSSPPFRDRITSQVAGIGGSLTRAQPKTVSNYPVPIPSLQTQNKVANSLDQAEQLISLRKKQLQKLDDLVKARFVEMFGPCTQRKRLEDYTELITKGASPKWQGVDYSDEGTLFVTSENVREGYVDLSKRKYLPDTINEIQPRSVLHRNDVLINIVGASIGRAAIFNSDELANINQAVALVRLRENSIRMKFLITFLNSQEAQRSYGFMKKGGARDNLSLKNIADLLIPVATIMEQDRFVAFVSQVDKSKFSIQQSLEKLETLKQSLMQQYFG